MSTAHTVRALLNSACLALAVLGMQGSAAAAESQANEERASPVVTAHEQRCEAGDGAECRRLGARYATGRSTSQAPERAAVYYTRACDLDDPLACVLLGQSYLDGEGVKRDPFRTQSLWKKAGGLYQLLCDRGGADACGRLGGMYLFGRGMEADRRRGIDLAKKACAAGGAYGCEVVAIAHEEGFADDKEGDRLRELERARDFRVKAREVRAQACKAGDEDACVALESSRPAKSQ